MTTLIRFPPKDILAHYELKAYDQQAADNHGGVHGS